MKKYILILIMFATTMLGAMAQESFAKQFKGKDGYSCVTIGKAALKMMPAQSRKNLKVGRVADKIDRLEIVSANNEESSARLSEACNYWIEKDGFESLIDVDDNGEQASIMMKSNGKNNIYLLLANEKRNTSVIIIYGTLTLEEIREMTGGGE